jgi:dCTP deaminase
MEQEQPRLFPLPTEESNEATQAGTGILPYQSIAEMVRSRVIMAASDVQNSQIQPASLDLRLGRSAYRVRASFLPGERSTVMEKVVQMDGLPPLDLQEGAVLEKGCVYVIPLLEHLKLPHDIRGAANPRSTTGRLDVLTRLITDHGVAFDKIPLGYSGPLYVEVVPTTFSILVRQGSRVNQLRLQRGNTRISIERLTKLYHDGQIVHIDGSHPRPMQNDDLVPLTVDLRGIGRPGCTIGYRAKKHTDKIDIDLYEKYDLDQFWDRLEYYGTETLILDPDEFYILATCEEVGIPIDLAAEMVPYYPGSGEYRVHYAGFFDPGFGWAGRAGGSRAVLEVRSYVPFMLEHAQIVGWLRYMRMMNPPQQTYGETLRSSYQHQGLALSKHFRRQAQRL